jgi:hypothetical protein
MRNCLPKKMMPSWMQSSMKQPPGAHSSCLQIYHIHCKKQPPGAHSSCLRYITDTAKNSRQGRTPLAYRYIPFNAKKTAPRGALPLPTDTGISHTGTLQKTAARGALLLPTDISHTLYMYMYSVNAIVQKNHGVQHLKKNKESKTLCIRLLIEPENFTENFTCIQNILCSPQVCRCTGLSGEMQFIFHRKV